MCFHEEQNSTSQKGKAQLCFRKQNKRTQQCFRILGFSVLFYVFLIFLFFFFVKWFAEPINNGFIFNDRDARNLTVKMIRYFNSWFK